MSNLKFLDACMSGDVLYEEIDDYIDAWHDGDSTEELNEFLGMTEKEYSIWVENANTLKYIIDARIKDTDIEDYLEEKYGNMTMAARASSLEEAKFIRKWLERTGRIKE